MIRNPPTDASRPSGRRCRNRVEPLPLMALAQVCLGANAVALHFHAKGAVTLALPVAALALVSAAFVVWVRERRGRAHTADLETLGAHRDSADPDV